MTVAEPPEVLLGALLCFVLAGFLLYLAFSDGDGTRFRF